MSPSSIERFPYMVDSVDHLEPAVRTALSSHLQPGETIERIIVAPPKEMVGIPRAWRQRLDIQVAHSTTMSWVLVLTESRLLIVTVSQPNVTPPVISIPIARLLWVELGIILLFGWFECGWAGEDRVMRARIFFNTVGEEHFQDLRTNLCRTLIEQDGLALATSNRGRVEIDAMPFKLVNMIDLKMLLPDEHIERLIYRLTTWKKYLLVFKRLRAPSTVAILSNYHLLIGNEDPSQHDAIYGWITRFCPRRRVRRVTVDNRGSEVSMNISIGLNGVEETFSVLFPAEIEPDLVDWTTPPSED